VFWYRLTNCVYTADVFCIPDIYVIIVLIFYFFLEPALMAWRPFGFQQINIVVLQASKAAAARYKTI